jgi:hypothetical protein
MSADLRGFHYPLEALLQRRRWELESVEGQLGRAVRELEQAVGAAAELRSRHVEQSRRAARALEERLDPVSHPRSLHWLTILRGLVRAAEERVDQLRAERARILERLAIAQRKVSVIERHREDCVAEYATEEAARACVEADRDWIVREGRRGAARGGSTS